MEFTIASEFLGIKKECVGDCVEEGGKINHKPGIYMDLSQIIRLAHVQGYKGVEHAPFIDGLALDTPWLQSGLSLSIDESDAMEKTGCNVTGLHWIMSFLNLVNPPKEGLSIFAGNDKFRESQEYYVKIIDRCAALGGKYVVHGSPPSRRLPDGMSHDQGLQKAADFFNIPLLGRCVIMSLADYAAAKGVRIGFEALADAETNFIQTPEQAYELILKVKNPVFFGMTIDVKAMAGQKDGRTVPEIIRGIDSYSRGKIVAVHFNDPLMYGPGLGPDPTDFRPIIEAVYEIGFKGLVTVEPFKVADKGKNSQEDCRKIIEYLNRCDKEVRGG